MDTVKRLYILDFGLFQVHENGRVIGIPGYLIQSHAGQNILVDTGFPAKYAADAERATKEDGLDIFGRVLNLTQDNLPAGQLAKIGLTPADIDTLILTHSDIDHVGGLGDFLQATLVIHADERAYERPRYWNGRFPLTWPNNKTQLIEEDTKLCPGMTLLSTPGHAPGHLSLLLHLPETGYVLLIGDAISRPSELQEGFGGAWNHDLARTSADKLMSLAQTHNAFIIYGHDPDQWPTLRKVPNFYS